MADAQEMARIRQRQFYLEMAERFRKMADEYAPAQHAAVPLPINGFTVSIIIHGSSHEELNSELRALDVNWYHMYAEMGRATTRDMHTGRTSVRFEQIDPDQTPEKYALELAAWANEMKDRRRAVGQ